MSLEPAIGAYVAILFPKLSQSNQTELQHPHRPLGIRSMRKINLFL
jgi:hypothetical protein